MHGVLRLIQNELSKIYHQISWRVLTLLLLLLSIGAPILSYLFSASYDENSYYANAEKYAEDYEEGSITKEYFLNIAASYNYFKDQGFNEEDWQFDNYFREYMEINNSIKGCQLYLDGRDIDEILGDFNIENVYYTWEYVDGKETRRVVYSGHLTWEEQPAETLAPDGIIGISNDYYGDEVPFTAEIAQKIIAECEERREIIKGMLKQTFEELAAERIDQLKPNYERAKEAYEAAKTKYERDKSAMEEYTGTKLVKEGYDIFFEALNRMDLKNVSRTMQNSFAYSLHYLSMTIENGMEFSLMSEKKFDGLGYDAYFMGSSYDDYSDYVRAVEQRQDQYYKTVKKYTYSLEHNLPLFSYQTPVRSMTEDSLTVNLTVIMLMGIFMSAVIMASEHTSGAVRLLMIRPRARWKILLSKLCCVMIFLIGWIVSTSVLSTVTNGILFGWDGLSIPYVMVESEAYEVAVLPYLIMKMTVSFLPGLSMVFLAFLMSVLVKRAVVSMAIPMMIYIFGAPASHIFVGRACKVFPPLKLTPIPYFDLANFWCEPGMQLESYSSPLDHGLTLNMGVLMFVIYSIILIAAAFVIFKKQQIKN